MKHITKFYKLSEEKQKMLLEMLFKRRLSISKLEKIIDDYNKINNKTIKPYFRKMGLKI